MSFIMLTAAITAAITWILGLFGVEPALSLIVGIGVAVKVVIVSVVAFLGWRALKTRQGASNEADANDGSP